MSRRQAARPTVTIPTVEQKQCSKCHVIKGAAEFFRREQSHDGLQSWCRACKNAARQGNVSAHQALQHQSYADMSDGVGNPGAASLALCILELTILMNACTFLLHLQVLLTICKMHTTELCRRQT